MGAYPVLGEFDSHLRQLEYLHIGKADLFGFSNGGTIALQVAIRHPKVVRKLVVASALVKRDGAYPWLWDAMTNARLEDMPQEPREAYLKVAPQPENLRMMHDKAVRGMRDFKDIPAIYRVDLLTFEPHIRTSPDPSKDQSLPSALLFRKKHTPDALFQPAPAALTRFANRSASPMVKTCTRITSAPIG